MSFFKKNNVGRWLARFIELQCFLTLVSLPILLCWGIPFSALTFIGNLIFTPVLTAFLILCTLIFTAHLLHVPHTWLIRALEYLTYVWHWCLARVTTTWLIPLQQPSFVIAGGIVAATLIIMHLQRPRSVYKRAFIMSTYLLIVITLLRYLPAAETTITIPYGKGTVRITHHAGIITLTDQHAFASRPPSKDWVQYTLIPKLIRHFGSTHISRIVTEKETRRIIQMVQYIKEATAYDVIRVTSQ